MKLTTKKLKELISEEKQASRMYRKYGFNKLAKQERGHHNFLKKKLERRIK